MVALEVTSRGGRRALVFERTWWWREQSPDTQIDAAGDNGTGEKVTGVI